MSDQWFLDQARLGNMYHACSAGAVTLSTVNKTCTGLSLSNPHGSGKLLVIKKISFQPSTAPAGVSLVGIAISTAVNTSADTHTTPMVIHNALTAGATIVGAGRADASSTLVETPLWLRPMGSVTAGSSITPTKYVDETDGDIILVPGSALSLSYLTTAAIGIASVTWAEIDE